MPEDREDKNEIALLLALMSASQSKDIIAEIINGQRVFSKSNLKRAIQFLLDAVGDLKRAGNIE